MASTYHIQAISATFLVIAFLLGGSHHVAEGFKVNLQMYFSHYNEGDHLYFESHQPNLDAYRELLPNVLNFCGMGCWAAYNGYNYTDLSSSTFMGSYYTNYSLCNWYPIHEIKSLRFLGSSEPTNISLSLYEGTSYTGKETLIEGRVLTGITSKVASFISTGFQSWTLFEGPQLDGNSYCFLYTGQNFYYYTFGDGQSPGYNLTTICSVFRGCDIAEIKEYKRNNNM